MAFFRRIVAAILFFYCMVPLTYASSITLKQLFILHKGLGARTAAQMIITVNPPQTPNIAEITSAQIQFYRGDCTTLLDSSTPGTTITGGSFTFSSGDSVSLNSVSLFDIVFSLLGNNVNNLGCISIQLSGTAVSGALTGNPGSSCPLFLESCSKGECQTNDSNPISFESGTPCTL